MKRPWFWVRVLGTVLALSLLVWLLWEQNWGALLSALGRLSVQVLGTALGLYWLGLPINAWRWRTLLRGVGIPISWKKAVRLVLAGAFVSNFLPSTVGGDALRVAGILDIADLNTAFASVVVDRGLNVIAMYSFLPLTWKTFGTFLPAVGWSGGMKAAGLLGGFWWRLGKLLKKFIGAIGAWMRSPRTLAAGLVISWLSLLPSFTATWILARSLGIPVAWYEVAGATVISYTMGLLPISLNGYGVREVTVVGLYSLLGATTEQAVMLALVTRFLMVLSTLTGAPWVGEAVPKG